MKIVSGSSLGVFLLSGILTLGSFAGAAQLSPYQDNQIVKVYESGQRLHAYEDPYFTIDEKTLKDLEFDKAYVPHLAEFAPSQLGQHRLRWLLTHPLTRIEDIKERQNLIRTLAENDELMNELGQIFSEIKKAMIGIDGEDIFKQIHTLTDTSYGKPLSLQSISSLLFTGIGVTSLGYAAMSGSLSSAALGLVQLGGLNLATISQMRAKSMLTMTQKLEPLNVRLMDAMAKLKLSPESTLGAAVTTCRDQGNCLSKLHKINAVLQSGRLSSLAVDLTTLANPLVFASVDQIRKKLPEILTWYGAIAELEAYYALAEFYRSNKATLIFPNFHASPNPFINIVNGHLPYILYSEKFGSIANNAIFDEAAGPKASVLTGPNAGGKTTYLRMIATLILMAQTGAPIPADFADLVPISVYTNFANEKDSSTEGLSTFQAQSKRAADLLRTTEKSGTEERPSFVAMDEILVGTSELEHTAAERAVLEELYSSKNVLSILATHYRELTHFPNEVKRANNLHVTLRGYAIEDGPSTDYNALEVMADQKVPDRVIKRAQAHLDSLRATGKCETYLDEANP